MSSERLDPPRVKGWTFRDVLLETREGDPPPVPPHAHDTYQVGFTTRAAGWYLCDGRKWLAPPLSIILFHPGEVHCVVEGGTPRVSGGAARAAYIPPQRLADIAADVSGRPQGAPHFPERVIVDPAFVKRFVHAHEVLESAAGELEKDQELLDALSDLVTGFGEVRASMRATRDQSRAQLVRDYIDAHFADEISLNTLAALAGVSPFHLSRLFKKEVGMPPHAYQSQRRVERAKSLLLQGAGTADAALQAGFFDQSHFGRHFRRILGVPPASYLRARHRPAQEHPMRLAPG